MVFGWKKDKDKKEISPAEEERRDRMAVVHTGGQAARRHKPLVEAWKNLCKGMQTDWVERLSMLMEEDLKAGGVKVPSSLDTALDGSAAVMSMAEASAKAVQDMANEQILQIQTTVSNHRVYLAAVEEDIANGEKVLTEVRADIMEEKVRLEKVRHNYLEYMKEITDKDKPVAPSDVSPPPREPLPPRSPAPEPVAEPPKELSLKEKAHAKLKCDTK